jgi:two-component system chemotaxis response regulator CheB
LEVQKSLNGNFLKLSKGDKVSGHRPSIDVLFNSIAETYGKETVAVIMTGMGRDGATGIHNIRNKGGFTIAQDEATSVVFGMNKVAIHEDGINDIVPLQNITGKIVEHI